MRTPPGLLALLVLTAPLGSPLAAQEATPPDGEYVRHGPHRVGFRVLDHRDRTRRTGPRTDFTGRPTAHGPVPLQASIWYPAAAAGTPLARADYLALDDRRETLGAPTAAQRREAGARLLGPARFGLGVALPRREADSLAAQPVRATRDAPPARGRFPVVVAGAGGAGAAAGLGEYLASHGWVVVSAPSLPRTATLQVTRPQVALETQARNLELLLALAMELPFVDTTRIALLGANFDGMAALVHQMRGMGAAAVVSLDGWEGHASASILRAAPDWDPLRMRVPYLHFSQDAPPSPALAFDDAVLGELRHADRAAYVVRGMDHVALLQDLTIHPQLTAERRLAYDFTWRTVRAFLDAHVRGDAAARAWLARTPEQNGYPSWLVRTALRHAALPPLPDAEEVERLAMAGDVERLRAKVRRARAMDSTLVLVPRGTLALFASRYAQRGDRAAVLALHELAVEAFPRSAQAASALGDALRDAGERSRARTEWARALALVDADPDVAPDARAQLRSSLEEKLRAPP